MGEVIDNAWGKGYTNPSLMNEQPAISRADEEDLKESIRPRCGLCKDLYHGTSRDAAREIKRKKKLRFGHEVGYLGRGFYCYLHDINASKIYARTKYKDQPIAVIRLAADLGNLLFVSVEFQKMLRETASRLDSLRKGDIDKRIGLLIESIIDRHIKIRYDMVIHTVVRAYIISKKRPAVMYCVRMADGIKSIKLFWEENNE